METSLQTYQIIFYILGTGVLISTSEYLTRVKIFSPNGLLSWDIQQLDWIKKDSSPMFKKFLSIIYRESGFKYIFLFRCINIILLFFIPLTSLAGWILLIVLTLSILTSSLMTRYGSDGSDQMSMLTIITLILCMIPTHTPLLLNAGLWFIALQSCLSYTVAGISKLISKEWTSSRAVMSIFSTKTYGKEKVALALKKYRFLNVFLCWNVMIAEAFFPLCLVLPLHIAIAFLIWGFIFHLLTAIIMGLNSFFWAFMATYPAIIFVNLQIHQ